MIRLNIILAALAAVIITLGSSATSTTYTFTSASWSSRVGTVVANGSTDGWVCDLAASDYSSGYTDAQGLRYSCGVGVKKATTGAGATSVIVFQNVRKVVVNYCQNASRGKGAIRVRVGDGEPVSLEVQKPESGQGQYNRDAAIELKGDKSGKVSFAVDCEENGIYINTITIKADNGSPNNPALSASVFRLVTAAEQLQSGDKVIIGVAQTGVNYILGLYDEGNSRNNIFAVAASYGADRQTVGAKTECVYTVERTDDGRIAFRDALDWWLVASGGNPNSGNNNYLTVWDEPRSDAYGDYGLWRVTVEPSGEAVIESSGKSRSKYLQYNPAGANGHAIFACYGTLDFAPPAIYRQQDELADGQPHIACNFVNFGTQLLPEGRKSISGEKTVNVEALNLTADIDVRLKNGNQTFSLDKTVLDRDGEELTVKFVARGIGTYADTIVLSSGGTTALVPVMLTVDIPRTVEQARQMPDLEQCFLKPVAVTKKYDRYIFVRDDTGAMLLYDNGNVYGKGLENGDVLTDVAGYVKNYYGNPELRLNQKFTVTHGDEQAPVTKSSAEFEESDICQYVRLHNVAITDVQIYDLFKYLPANGMAAYDTSARYNIEGIVYYYDGYCICPTLIEQSSAVEAVAIDRSNGNDAPLYDLQGRKIPNGAKPVPGIYIKSGKKIIVR